MVKPDSELIHDVELPVDLILVTPFRSRSPVLRCFFNFKPCKIRRLVDNKKREKKQNSEGQKLHQAKKKRLKFVAEAKLCIAKKKKA